MCVFTSSRDPSTVNKPSHTRKIQGKNPHEHAGKKSKKITVQKRGLAHLHFPPLDSREHRKSYTSCWCLLAKKHTKSEKRGRKISGREGEKGGITHQVLNLRHWIPSPMRSCCSAQKKAPKSEVWRDSGCMEHELTWSGFKASHPPCLDPRMPRRILEAHADSLRQIKKWKMKNFEKNEKWIRRKKRKDSYVERWCK